MEPWTTKDIKYEDLKLSNEWSYYTVYESIIPKKTSRHKEKDYLDNIKKIFTFSNLADFLGFWRNTIYNQITSIFTNPYNLTVKQVKGTDFKIGSLALFRDNIRPEWEDPKNMHGGEYSVKFNGGDKNEIINMWQTIIFSVVGGTFEGVNEVYALLDYRCQSCG